MSVIPVYSKDSYLREQYSKKIMELTISFIVRPGCMRLSLLQQLMMKSVH